jgi:hypothetical protein
VLNLLRSLLLAGLAFVRTRRQLAVEILALRPHAFDELFAVYPGQWAQASFVG